MLDGIPPALLTGGGLTGVLTFLIVAFVKGWLYPSAWVDRIVADKDQQIGFLHATVESLTASVQKYAVSAETSAHALHEVEKQARAAKAGGE